MAAGPAQQLEAAEHMPPAGDHAASDRGLLRLLTCGSVDDGKSTLIGRMLYELDLIPLDQLRAVERASRRGGGSEPLDLALLLDGLEAEREQGITIDVAYRYFRGPRRSYIVADAPGHEQYTRNMATGASVSDVAILLVDARKGLLTQTRRHSQIVARFGIRHVALAINKCDLVDFSSEVFDHIATEYRAFAAELGFYSITAIPLSALYGDNVLAASPLTPWYEGPTLFQWLEAIDVEHAALSAPLRLPVQFVSRPNADFRGYMGTVTSGMLRAGDRVAIAPSGATTTVARLLQGDVEIAEAPVGSAVTVVLAEEIDVSRGDVVCAADAPAEIADQFAGHLLWFSDAPMIPGRSYLLKIGTRTTPVSITALKYVLDVDTGMHAAARSLALNEIGFCNFAVPNPIPVDPFERDRTGGSFILIDRFTNATVGAGTVAFALRRAHNVHPQKLDVDKRQRQAVKPHAPAILWFTGLPASGKSTIASLVERKLNRAGCHTYLIDGDNVRGGLNRDLGFTEVDRVENVRRVAEVARLFVDAGLIVIVSLISPYRSDRLMARERVAEGEFIEVFVDTPVEVCRARDPKGLYARALRGEILNFTGVDGPYETPDRPELRVATVGTTADALSDEVIAYLRRTGIIHV